MARFAIFYNREDLTPIAAEMTNVNLSAQDRNTANRYWVAGVRDWASAPLAPVEQRCVDTPMGQMCDDDMRIVVIDGNQVSKAGLIALLRKVGNTYPGARYMIAIADDMENTAIEPWP